MYRFFFFLSSFSSILSSDTEAILDIIIETLEVFLQDARESSVVADDATAAAVSCCCTNDTKDGARKADDRRRGV